MSRLCIRNENVCDQRGDLIVCEVDGSFSPMNGSGQQIWKEAGWDDLSLLRPKKPLQDYQIIETPAFKLEGRIKKILHIKMPSFSNVRQDKKNNYLRMCYLSVLQKAVELDVKSLAFPFLGIVSSNFPTKEAVEVALATINEFKSIKRRKDSLDKITFFSVNTQEHDLAIVHKLYQNLTRAIPKLSDCSYRVNTPGVYETTERSKCFDLTMITCGGKSQSINSFIDQIGLEVTLHGCQSVVELLSLRANGETVDETNELVVGTRIICEHHFCSLITNWEKPVKGRVSAHQVRSPDGADIACPLVHKKSANAISNRVVTKIMCIEWLRCEGALIPPGSTVCKRHYTDMSKGADKHRKKTETEIDPTVDMGILATENELSREELLDSILDDSGVVEPSPAKPIRVERKFTPDTVDTIKKLVELLGGDRVLTRGEWKTIKDDTKRKKVYLVKRILDAVCGTITPDGKEELLKLATKNRYQEDHILADRLFDSIDERFANASSTQEKVELLSLVSDLGLTMKETIRCVPSATLHYLNLAKNFNRGGVEFDTVHRREKFDEKKSDRFVEFIARSNVLVTLPWGDAMATLSDGTKTSIASVARKFTYSRIHRLYLRDLEASSEIHLKLSRGSTTRILKVLAKRKNERMACVDEFAVDAIQGWRNLLSVIEELRELHGLIGDGDERALKRWIRISRSHLEGEYISEICESSNIPQHCTRFALSDPRKKCFCTECDHIHDGSCTNCDQLDLLMSNLTSLTDRLIKEAETGKSSKVNRIKRLDEIVKFSCLNIRTYQAHILRTALSNNGRAQIQESLQDGEALLTLDFAMKILPLKAIEGQSGFFGKRGITLHITHVLAKNDGKIVDHTFAHSVDDTKQDSGLVYSIVQHVLGILEKKGIHTVTLRSDNAGTYKNGALISALFHLSSSKLKITGYYFSESQAGKGPCDRCAAHCKRKMNEWTRDEKDICNAYNIFEALTVEDETVRGLSTYYCTFNDTTRKVPNVFPGISKFFAFDFEEDGVRTRCQYGIGEGQLTKKEKLPTIDCSLTIEVGGGHEGDSFWSSFESEEKVKENTESEEEDTDHNVMLHCSTVGCTKLFRSNRWLDEHERKGVHVFAEKKLTMTDRSVKMFNELIETREAARIAVTEQVEAIGNNGPRNELEQGWALKGAQGSPRGLNKIAKEHAELYFYNQRSLNRRAEALVMRKKLEELRKPSNPTEYLLDYSEIPSEKQLISLFSREEKKRVKGSPSTKAKPSKVPKSTNEVGKKSKPGSRAKSSVRSTKGSTRKRSVIKSSEESEESEMDDDVFEDEREEDEEDEEEMLGLHEEDFMKKVIEEDVKDIFL